MPGNVILADLNIDENQDVYAFSKIRSIPTMISFVNGDKMDVIATSDPSDITAFFATCKQYVYELDGSEPDELPANSRSIQYSREPTYAKNRVSSLYLSIVK